MSTPTFTTALEEMQKEGRTVYEPRSFKGYLRAHGLPDNKNTAHYISIDHYGKLQEELRENDTMVLRLGKASKGRGTQFALVQIEDGLEDFFLFHKEIFTKESPQKFQLRDEQKDRLLGYSVLPKLSETSLVNLALASGLLGEALDIDHDKAMLPPATGRSTFTFNVKPHTSLDQTFEHRSGQVEIDTLFAERRNGEQVLFVLEAKTGPAQHSIAKHKLMYPVLAVVEKLKNAGMPDLPIVPVYLYIEVRHKTIHYRVVECRVPDVRENLPALDELQKLKEGYYTVEV